MILMQMVAEGGEKVKVEALDRGRVRVFINHGPAGVSSFIIPAGSVVSFAAALVNGSPSPNLTAPIEATYIDAEQTFVDGKLASVRFLAGQGRL